MKIFLLTLMSLMTFLTAEEIIVTYSSTEDVGGMQWNFTGGGTFSQYSSPTNEFGQVTDYAAIFYDAINVTPQGLVMMFSFAGYDVLSTNGETKTLLTLENTGGSDICIDVENDFFEISSPQGIGIAYATVDPNNCLHLIVSNVVSGCTNESACNYNPEATADDNSCLVPNSNACEACLGTSIVTNDDDNDGICNDIDDCFGTLDNCGLCNGDGSTCLPQEIIVTYSSTEDVGGMQWRFSGGGTFSPYSSPTNEFGQVTDYAAIFYDAITINPQGLVMMFSFAGYDLLSTNGETKTLLTLENTGGSDICIDVENDFFEISDPQGNGIAYATVDPNNCLHLIVSNVVNGCTNELACNYNADATDDDGSCLIADASECELCAADGSILIIDDDNDGICNYDDDCFGTLDNCGLCNGDGSTCLPQEIIVTYSSTEDVGGMQWRFSGGGTFSPYSSPTNEFGQVTDYAAIFYDAITINPQGLVMMFSFAGYDVLSTNGEAKTLLTLENTGGSDICIDVENDFFEISDPQGNGIAYATVDPNNCLHLIVSAVVVSGCTNGAACNYNANATDDDGSCLVPDSSACESCSGSTVVTNDADNDGICDDSEINGCTNSSACNYNSNATDDDGSCSYADQYYDCNGDCLADSDNDGVCNELEVSGCTTSSACNYNPDATDNNGSCLVPDASECESCATDGSIATNDADNDGVCDDVDECVGTIDTCGVCNGDGSSCPDIVCTNLPENTFYINSEGEVYYNISNTLAGFQFTVNGAVVQGLSGGAASSQGMTLSSSSVSGTVVGFSISTPPATIPPGSGQLTLIDLLGTPTGLSGIVLTAPVNENNVAEEFGSLESTYLCQNPDCAVDADNDGVCDDVDDCVGTVDTCGLCNGPGAIYDCGCAGIPQGDCDCNGSVEDALGTCGGSCVVDADNDGVCDDVDDCVGTVDDCGLCNGDGSSCAADHIVYAGNYYYNPTSLEIDVGDEVEWINELGFHDVNGNLNALTGQSYNNPESFYISPTGPGVIGRYTFNVPGIYNYDCSIGNHAANGMVATVTVGLGGCMDSSACNYNANVDFNNNSCVFANQYYDCNGDCLADSDNDGVCNELEVSGCTTSSACNYNSNATDDDGSCTYANQYYDCNGDCLADSDNDGVCNELEVVGCQNSIACNYNEAATDAGSCNLPSSCDTCNENGTVNVEGGLVGCQICDGGAVLDNDADNDGVCDNVDDCIGTLDSCGTCNGDGPSYDCGDSGDLVCSESDCPTTGGVVVDINLESGWNWISTNVLSDNMTPNSVIADAADGDFLKNQSTFSQYYDGYGWYGGVGLINIGESYKLNLQGSYNWTYTGASVNPADYLISLNPGWNWLGYIPNTSLLTNDALNFSAEDGDFIKSQSTFSQYYDGYGWYGGVTTMDPFSGYLLNVNSANSFYYPNSLSRIIENIESFDSSFDFNYSDYEFNGSVTASVDISNVEISEDDILFAFDSNGNIRGKASPVYFPLTNEYIFMLMIFANRNDEIISFEYYDYSIDNSYTLNNTINFQSDMIIGDGFSPMSFGLSNAEEVSSLSISKAYPNPFNPSTNLEYSIADPGFVKITVFDVAGRQVSIIENSYKNSGEHKLTWNAENNTSGIYYIQISSGSEVKAQKVVLLK